MNHHDDKRGLIIMVEETPAAMAKLGRSGKKSPEEQQQHQSSDVVRQDFQMWQCGLSDA
jgi:hypothetical protein